MAFQGRFFVFYLQQIDFQCTFLATNRHSVFSASIHSTMRRYDEFSRLKSNGISRKILIRQSFNCQIHLWKHHFSSTRMYRLEMEKIWKNPKQIILLLGVFGNAPKMASTKGRTNFGAQWIILNNFVQFQRFQWF